jgi:hypothetical protein
MREHHPAGLCELHRRTPARAHHQPFTDELFELYQAMTEGRLHQPEDLRGGPERPVLRDGNQRHEMSWLDTAPTERAWFDQVTCRAVVRDTTNSNRHRRHPAPPAYDKDDDPTLVVFAERGMIIES